VVDVPPAAPEEDDESEAERDARRTRGEGDAERTRITNEAFSKDPEFYQFLRSMEAYEVALRHIRENREAIDRITEELLEKETLTGDEMRSILSQYATIPEENLKAAREQEEAKEAVVA